MGKSCQSIFSINRLCPITLTSTGWISSDPKFDPQAPYLNRDPRFYQTVLYNGAKFKGQTIETFMGGQDEGSVTSGGTATGYFLKKNTLEDVNFIPGSIVSKPHYWVIFRYGEILLNYAEAMVGAFKSPDYKDGVFTMSEDGKLEHLHKKKFMVLKSLLLMIIPSILSISMRHVHGLRK